MDERPKDPWRRRVIDAILRGGLLTLLGSVFYPIYRYSVPPARAEAQTGTVLAGTVGELPPSSGKIFRFGSKPGILIRTPEGELRAFTAICTHLGCTVQYRDDLQHIWCACHNGHFDLRGLNIGGPPPRPLEEYRVAVRDGGIYVSRQA